MHVIWWYGFRPTRRPQCWCIRVNRSPISHQISLLLGMSAFVSLVESQPGSKWYARRLGDAQPWHLIKYASHNKQELLNLFHSRQIGYELKLLCGINVWPAQLRPSAEMKPALLWATPLLTSEYDKHFKFTMIKKQGSRSFATKTCWKSQPFLPSIFVGSAAVLGFIFLILQSHCAWGSAVI